MSMILVASPDILQAGPLFIIPSVFSYSRQRCLRRVSSNALQDTHRKYPGKAVHKKNFVFQINQDSKNVSKNALREYPLQEQFCLLGVQTGKGSKFGYQIGEVSTKTPSSAPHCFRLPGTRHTSHYNKFKVFLEIHTFTPPFRKFILRLTSMFLLQNQSLSGFLCLIPDFIFRNRQNIGHLCGPSRQSVSQYLLSNFPFPAGRLLFSVEVFKTWSSDIRFLNQF